MKNNKKEIIIDQTIEQVKINPERIDLIFDNIQEDDETISVLSKKQVLQKYLNLKKKQITKQEFDRLFVKVMAKEGFTTSLSHKSVDKINIIEQVTHKDIIQEVKRIKNFVSKKEKEIFNLHKLDKFDFKSETKKEIAKVSSQTINAAFEEIDNLLKLTQDVVFNVEVDWYYNKIFDKLKLSWFVKEPSFYNPVAVNKIIVDDVIADQKAVLEEFPIEYLYIDFNQDIKNVDLFNKTLERWISSFESKLLEKDLIQNINKKFLKFSPKKLDEIHERIIEFLEKIKEYLSDSTIKKINSNLKVLGKKQLAINGLFSSISDGVVNKESAEKLNKITILSKDYFNKFHELIQNIVQEKRYKVEILTLDLVEEIQKVDLESEVMSKQDLMVEKTRIFFESSINKVFNEFAILKRLIDTVNLYYKLIMSSTSSEAHKNVNGLQQQIEFIAKNNYVEFSNESPSYNFTSKEVEEYYNEVINLTKEEVDEQISLKGILYLNNLINKIFIILDYAHKSLKLILTRAKELDKPYDIPKKDLKKIQSHIMHADYDLATLLKLFNQLNSRFDKKNIARVISCVEIIKKLNTDFAQFVNSSKEYSYFNQFHEIALQDLSILTQTLNVFKIALDSVKENKNKILFSSSALSLSNKKLISDKKLVEDLSYDGEDCEKINCLECEKIHSKTYFEEKLLVDLDHDAKTFKKSVLDMIKEFMRLKNSNVKTYDAQNFIFKKALEFLTIENGIIKDLTFISKAMSAQISSIMLNTIFNEAQTYLSEESHEKIYNNKLEHFITLLNNNILVLKFSSMKLLVLKNLQEHLLMKKQIDKVLETIDLEENNVGKLFSKTLETKYSLASVIDDMINDTRYKNDRSIQYLYHEFTKNGLVKEVKNGYLNQLKEEQNLREVGFDDHPTQSLEDNFYNVNLAHKEEATQNSNIESGVEQDFGVEVYCYENDNDPKSRIDYSDLLTLSNLNIIYDVEIISDSISSFKKAKDTEKSINSIIEEYLNSKKIYRNTGIIKEILAKDRTKEKVIFGSSDYYYVSDYWVDKDFKKFDNSKTNWMQTIEEVALINEIEQEDLVQEIAEELNSFEEPTTKTIDATPTTEVVEIVESSIINNEEHKQTTLNEEPKQELDLNNSLIKQILKEDQVEKINYGEVDSNDDELEEETTKEVWSASEFKEFEKTR